MDQALTIGHRVGYPVLVRPSFVLGGWGMEIVNNDEDLTNVREGLEKKIFEQIMLDIFNITVANW